MYYTTYILRLKNNNAQKQTKNNIPELNTRMSLGECVFFHTNIDIK